MSTLVIGFGKKKPGIKPSMPPPEMPGSGKRGRMPRAPKSADAMPSRGGDEPDADDQGITPEEVCYSENDLCGTCKHSQGGTCNQYNFPVTETGHCKAGYEPADGPDDTAGAGDSGMASDGDDFNGQ